jgi:hypothetical protein
MLFRHIQENLHVPPPRVAIRTRQGKRTDFMPCSIFDSQPVLHIKTQIPRSRVMHLNHLATEKGYISLCSVLYHDKFFSFEEAICYLEHSQAIVGTVWTMFLTVENSIVFILDSLCIFSTIFFYMYFWAHLQSKMSFLLRAGLLLFLLTHAVLIWRCAIEEEIMGVFFFFF